MTQRSVPTSLEEVADLMHYSRKDAATILGISPTYLYGEIKARRIGYTVIAGSYKITGAHIKAYSAKREVKPLAVA
jgi:hypothetical protein